MEIHMKALTVANGSSTAIQLKLKSIVSKDLYLVTDLINPIGKQFIFWPIKCDHQLCHSRISNP